MRVVLRRHDDAGGGKAPAHDETIFGPLAEALEGRRGPFGYASSAFERRCGPFGHASSAFKWRRGAVKSALMLMRHCVP